MSAPSAASPLLTAVPLALEDCKDVTPSPSRGQTSRSLSRPAATFPGPRRISLCVPPPRPFPDATVAVPSPAKPRLCIPDRAGPLNGVRRDSAEQRFQRELDFAKAVKNQRFPPWQSLPILPPASAAPADESDGLDSKLWLPVAPSLVDL
jgi:hypothetical protein